MLLLTCRYYAGEEDSTNFKMHIILLCIKSEASLGDLYWESGIAELSV